MKVKDSLKGKLKVKVEGFPEGQQNNETVEFKHEIQLEAMPNIEVEMVKSTGQSEIDPRNSRVDLAQIYIVICTIELCRLSSMLIGMF